MKCSERAEIARVANWLCNVRRGYFSMMLFTDAKIGISFLRYEYQKQKGRLNNHLLLIINDTHMIYLYLICFRICSHPCLYKRVHSALKIHSLVKSSSIIILGLGSRRHFLFYTDIYCFDYFH